MIDNLTLDGADGVPVTLHAQTGKRMLNRAIGLRGIPTVRQVVRTRPTQHGAINESHWTDGSAIVLEGEVFSTVSIEDAFLEWDAIVKPMIETLDVGPALMKWREATTGKLLQKLVKLNGEVEQVLEGGQPSIAYQVQFHAEDPRAYSQTLNTVIGPSIATSGGATYPEPYPMTFDPTTGGAFAVAVAGNRPTPAVFRVYGDCTNAQLVLVGADKRIALIGRINPGDYLELDTQARTAKINGTSPAYNYIDSVTTTWFDLPVGNSTIQMIAGSFDTVAHCNTLYRDAYA